MRTVQAVQVIPAPLADVWSVLVDTASYGRWNPFVTELSGDLVEGGRISVRVAPPGGKPMAFRPVVTALDGRRLEWLGKLGVRGLFDGRHTFELHPLTHDTTRLTQREDFSGLLVPLMPGLLARTEAGFRAMNVALAREVAARAARVTSA